jgi:hypothetical protein
LTHKIRFAKLMFKKHIKIAWITGKTTNNMRKSLYNYWSNRTLISINLSVCTRVKHWT